jgi:predicted RND superfamily exporter protein
VTGLFTALGRRAGWVLTLASLLALAAAHQIVDLRTGERRIEIDTSFNRMLPSDDPAKKFYDRVRRIFGSDESMVVALVADDVFQPEHLETVVRLTQRISQLDGVHHVVSLANALNIRGVGNDLEIAPFISAHPGAQTDPAVLRREVLENPIYAGNLVTQDGTATALLVYFLDFSDREFVERGLDEKIAEIAEEERGEAQVWVSGMPRIKAVSARMMLRDLARQSPLVALVLAGVLALAFRSLHGVVAPLLSITFALIWTLGLVTALGYALTAVTVVVPLVLFTLGLAYSFHVVSAYEAQRSENPAGSRIDWTVGALSDVALPVLLTGFTTAAGFLSLMLSPLGAIREFGLLSVIGVLLTMLSSLTVAPVLLRLIGPRKTATTAAASASGAFDRFAGRVARFDLDHRRAIFMGAGAIALLAVFGATQIRIGTVHTTKFSPDAPVRVHFEAVNEHLEGANPFYVVVSADYADAFREPVNLQTLEDLQIWLAEQPEIGGTTSLVDYLKLINRGFHGNDPEYLRIPKSRRLVSQLLFFGANEEIERFVDSRSQMVSIAVRARVVDSDDVSVLIQTIERRLEDLPEHLTATVTGNPVLLNSTMDAIMRGQIWSLASAMLIIYVLLSFLFTSPRVGLIALIPNLFPVAVYFGALGLGGVSLTIGTSLIAPMVIGIAVDDTIHYFARFTRDAREMADDRRAVVSALRSVGRPVTYTSLALCLGFLVLTTSELQTQVQMGIMAAFALGVAWAADVVLTPALCAGLRVATLWDVLTLDLGPDPHLSIPLLSGLSKAQARFVALMTEVVSMPAGERLIQTGEAGADMYVVIDGELRASVVREDGPRHLSTHARGDVIGEVALFSAAHERTADVDVVENARLLRLTQSSLDRLRRRSPRIAAQVHRNLNEVLAARLARVTQRLR